MSAPLIPVLGGLSAVVSGICFLIARSSRRVLEELWAVDTYEARELSRMVKGMFDATVEVEGTVSCDEPVRSIAAGVDCCSYETRVYREEKRTRVVKESGPGGQRKTRTEIDYQWVPDLAGHDSALFKVQDDTGFTRVDPRKANIEMTTVFQATQFHREDWFGTRVGESETGQYKIEEKAFLPEGYVFVMGRATYDETSGAALIRYPEKGYLDPEKKHFIISRKSEKDLIRSKEKGVRILNWISAAALLGAVVCAALWLGF